MGDIAVLRRCRCCDRWRSIDSFKPLGLVCQGCVYAGRAGYGGVSGGQNGRIQRSRGISITPLGRAFLEAERRAAVAV